MQERNGQMTNWSMRKDGKKADIAKMVNRLAKRLDKMAKEKRWEYTDKKVKEKRWEYTDKMRELI